MQTSQSIPVRLRFLILFGLLLSDVAVVFSQCKLELFPQTKTIGVNVSLDPGDPEMDCSATLFFTTTPGSKPIEFEGFPLARVNNRHNKLSGVIAYVPFSDEGITEKIKVVLSDPTTPALNGIILEGKSRFANPPMANGSYRVWVVAPDGKGNLFTETAPGNLKDALDQIDSNARLELMPGTYYLRNYRWTNKRNIDITARNIMAPEGTVISGLDTNRLTWQPYGSTGIYFTTSTESNPNLLFYDSIRLFPFRSLDEMSRNKLSIGFNSLAQNVEFDANMDGFFRNPSTNPLCNSNWQYPRLLYVKLSDGSNPSDKNIRLTAAGYAMNMDGCENILMGGLKFIGYGVSPSAHAIELKDCNRISFSQCIFAMNDVGIQLSGSTSGTYIRDCEFYDGNFSWSAWKIKATYDDYNPYSCIFPYYSRLLERGAINISHGFTGRGLDIGYSSFHDYAQAGHLSPPSVNDAFTESYEIDFHHNRVSRCFEDGFEIDGDARNIRVFENEFEQINAPVSLAIAKGGPTYIYRNIFHHLKHDTFATHPDLGLQVTPGHPFKTNFGSMDTMGEVNFIHNTIDAVDGNSALTFFSPGTWKTFRVWNNIFVTDSGWLFQLRTPSENLPDLKGNLFYSNQSVPRYFIDTNYNDAQFFNTDDYTDFAYLFRKRQPGLQVFEIMSYGKPIFEGGTSAWRAYRLGFGSAGLGWPGIPGFSGTWYDDLAALGALPMFMPENVENQKASTIVLFPNPNNGELWWETTASPITSLIIYDLRGNEVFRTTPESGSTQLIHSLENGLYIVQMLSDSRSYSAKLVVLR